MWQLYRLMKGILAVLLLVGAVNVAAQSSNPSVPTYQWHGELVSADTTNSTLTVKSWVVDQEVVSRLKQFKAGERVSVVWSGLYDYASGVRDVRSVPAGNKVQEDFVQSAELASTEAPNQYLTFRLKAPEGSLAAIKDLTPGQWVTVTSRHRPSTEADAVVAVKPYGSSTN